MLYSPHETNVEIFERLTSNTTILTPNRRLSANLLKQYAKWQKQKNKFCWKTLDILPLYTAWLEKLWKEYSTKNIMESNILLTLQEEQIIWEQILRDAPENDHLLQISDSAKLAKSAWELLKRYRIKLVYDLFSITEDSRTFFKWANQFQNLCNKNYWIDQNSLSDILIDKFLAKEIKPPEKILLVGFTEVAPQYQYLLSICESLGTYVEFYNSPQKNNTVKTIGLKDTATEIRIMAAHARSLLEKSNSIGCVIPNLETARERVISIFSEICDPTCFNISAGKNLNSYPLIHIALQILQLKTTKITINNFGNLLRSPFIGEAEREQYKRAQFESKLLSANCFVFSLQDLINPKWAYNLLNSCPSLAKRIRRFIEKTAELPKLLSIRQWVNIFNEILQIFGWPGERSLNSQEYQIVQNCWLPLLNKYATFDKILAPQNYQKSLHYLNCLISSTVFQPESSDAPIQILGLLEAANLQFDHLWVMGLDDTTWPERPKPNPFIPLQLQKTLNMPNAHAERELQYCEKLTRELQQTSAHVIFSYPLQQEDMELHPSSLLKNYEEISIDQISLTDFIPIREKIFKTAEVDFFEDNFAPFHRNLDNLQGGTNIFKKQAECPFKAFAELRLHAKKIDDIVLGLRPQDRGSIIHKSLELIWKELQDSNTLHSKPDSEIIELISKSAKQSLEEVLKLNNKITTRFVKIEINRLKKLLWSWLQIEKSRPPFKVIAQEKEIIATIGNITTNIRVDRIDELEDGTQFIIDYKTGKNIECSAWFSTRPLEPQLPLYCITNSNQPIGIAFAQIHQSSYNLLGVSKNFLKIKSIKMLADMKHADATLWDDQTKIWIKTLTELANDYYEGKAIVDPKEHSICRTCHLQPLCRIHENKGN